MSVLTLSRNEELGLVSNGLTKLMEGGIEKNKKAILQILHEFPELKKQQFSSPEFQESIFQTYKTLFSNDIYDHIYSNIISYCEEYPFLIKKTLEDKELQKHLGETINSQIRSLGYALDCNYEKYPSNIESLSYLEKIYERTFVSEFTKNSNNQLLLKAFKQWLIRGKDAYTKRIYRVVKQTNIDSDQISDALYEVRGNTQMYWDNFEEKYLEYGEFPKEKIDDPETKERLWDQRIYKVGNGDIRNMQRLITAYPSIKETLDIHTLEKVDETAVNEEQDKIVRYVTKGVGILMSRMEGKEAVEFLSYFGNLTTLIPRESMVEAIYKGLEKLNAKNPEKIEFLSNFPITNEEAAIYLKSFIHSYKGTVKGITEILEIFPGFDFKDVFASDDVKDKFNKSIVGYVDQSDLNTIKEWINTDDAAIENTRISNFFDSFRSIVVKNDSHGYRLLDKLRQLHDLCLNKENLTEKFGTEEIKALFKEYISQSIPDTFYYNGLSSDYSAEKDLLKYNFLPITLDDIGKEAFKRYIPHCKTGNIPYRGNGFKYITDKIEKADNELVEAAITGLLCKLQPEYESYNFETRKLWIRSFMRELPFLKDHLQNNMIQEAVLSLKKHFLSEGKIDQAMAMDSLFTK